MRTAIFLMIWDATPVEREKIHDTLHFEAFLKARSKKKKTNNKSPHQGLDYNTLRKISNDTEILCLYNESEEKTKQVNSNFYFKISLHRECSMTKSIMFKTKSI